MPPYPVKRGQHPVETGKNPVERGSEPCGNRKKPCGKRVSTLWKRGQYPVEKGQSIDFFLFQRLTYPLSTCTILSQASEKYYSKMFIKQIISIIRIKLIIFIRKKGKKVPGKNFIYSAFFYR
jgi:hypothetical protein